MVLAIPQNFSVGLSTDSHMEYPVLPGPSPCLDQDLGLAGPQPVGPLGPSVGPTLLVMKQDTQKVDDVTVLGF